MESKRIKDITASFMLIMESNMKLSGSSITLDSIEQEWDDFYNRASNKGVKITEEEAYIIKNTIKTNLDVNLSSKAVHISDDKVTPWIKDAKSSINWKFWDTYEKYLKTENIPRKSIIQISEEIDDILDLTGNPNDKSDSWKKRGLVMGNVQSGKTLNFTGLINKAVDVGYKYIILIGSINDNNLRMQTQERVDEGFTGFTTSDLPKINRIGVGNSITRNIPDVIPLTTSELKQDFTKAFANRQSGNENTSKKEIPFLFVVKKNTTVLKNIYNWFKEINELDPENGIKMTSPVLFIDDEADWASPNTKNDDTNPTKINQNIRKILTLFNKTNYIAYTATPFANIFINHETTNESLGDDLFPKDFILKLHLSENYKGQDFYFPRNTDDDRPFNPIIEITPNTDVDKFRPKTKNGKNIRKVDINDPNRFRIDNLTDSLRDAIRCFVINNSIRALRKDKKAHNTMLINVTHRICLMNDISDCVREYLEDLKNSIRLSSALPKDQRNKNSHIQDLSNTYHNHYHHLSDSESFDEIVKEMNYCAQKIEVRSINSDKSGVSLDYKNYTDVGLSVIAVGGNKLSRGLTLEGLSVSYFDRTSKGSDTLTQMCRWFGYRPNYSDICKVYISQEYRNHYENISRIIDDLYQELEYMKSQRMTPKEYGIRVREHPDNITITAKNKMRNAKTATQSLDLWGSMTRHGMFRDDDYTNNKNLAITSDFLSMLSSKYNCINAENNIDIIFDGVDYDSVVKYITDMDIIPYGMVPKHAVCQFIERMKKEKCPPFKILLTNNKTSKIPEWYKLKKPCDKLDIFEKNRDLTIAEYKIKVGYRSMQHVGNFITYPRYQMGDPNDEKSLYKKSEIDQIQNYYNQIEKEVNNKDYKKLYNKEYRKNKLRNFPALVFHTYNCFVDSENHIEIPFSKPTIGFHISFPDAENVADTAEERIRLKKDIKLSYALNTVAQQQEIDFNDDGLDESEDE